MIEILILTLSLYLFPKISIFENCMLEYLSITDYLFRTQ